MAINRWTPANNLEHRISQSGRKFSRWKLRRQLNRVQDSDQRRGAPESAIAFYHFLNSLLNEFDNINKLLAQTSSWRVYFAVEISGADAQTTTSVIEGGGLFFGRLGVIERLKRKRYYSRYGKAYDRLWSGQSNGATLSLARMLATGETSYTALTILYQNRVYELRRPEGGMILSDFSENKAKRYIKQLIAIQKRKISEQSQ